MGRISREAWLAAVVAAVGLVIPRLGGDASFYAGIALFIFALAGFGHSLLRKQRDVRPLVAKMREGRTIRDGFVPARAITRTYEDVCRAWESETYDTLGGIDEAEAESFRTGQPERHPDYKGGFDPEFDWIAFMNTRIGQLDQIVKRLRGVA